MAAKSAPATPERALVDMLGAALDPTPVHWGFAPFETSEKPPALPVVVVQRLSYSTIGYEDMCGASPYKGDTVVMIHAWAIAYADARALAAAVRTCLAASAVGWRLQQETDQYEVGVRAWAVSQQWMCAGADPD